MNLNSKQRAFLRSCAHSLSPLVMIGKDGLDGNVFSALDEALTHHELVKVKVQAHKEETAKMAKELEERTASTLIAVIGFTAIYYREGEAKRYDLKNLRVKED